jgi:YVTN family beta-propeller protein
MMFIRHAAFLLLAFFAISAAAGVVYVADEGSNSVSVIDTDSLKRVATIAVGRAPHNVQIAPDGKLAWVTNEGERHTAPHGAIVHGEQGSPSDRGEIWAIDTSRNEVVAKIPVGSHPAHVVLTPDGRFAYVTNGGDDTVSIVDTAARAVVATVRVGEYPHGIRIGPDGKEAYVANLKGGTVSVIDTASMKEVAKIPVGKGPAQTGFTPDGRLGFVSLSQENSVALIDPATRKVVARIPVGTVPIQLFATPDSRLLLVANQGTKQSPGKTVSVIDIAERRVANTVETGAGAHGVIVDRDGRHAFVTNIYAGTVSVLDLKSMKVVANIVVGNSPNGISTWP